MEHPTLGNTGLWAVLEHSTLGKHSTALKHSTLSKHTEAQLSVPALGNTGVGAQHCHSTLDNAASFLLRDYFDAYIAFNQKLAFGYLRNSHSKRPDNLKTLAKTSRDTCAQVPSHNCNWRKNLSWSEDKSKVKADGSKNGMWLKGKVGLTLEQDYSRPPTSQATKR